MIYVELSDFEKQSIEQMLKKTQSRVTQNRCMCILLSAKRMSVVQVAIEVDQSWHTVYRLVTKWNASAGYKLGLLEIAKGRGAKPKLTEFPMEGIIKRLLMVHRRDIKAVLIDLETMYDTKICRKTLCKFIRCYNL